MPLPRAPIVARRKAPPHVAAALAVAACLGVAWQGQSGGDVAAAIQVPARFGPTAASPERQRPGSSVTLPSSLAAAVPGPRLRVTPVVWEVCFQTEKEAQLAVETLSGTFLGDRPLHVTRNLVNDLVTGEFSKVNVQGVHPLRKAHEVKQHFFQCGSIVFVKSAEDEHFGQVTFATADAAWRAKTELDGSELNGQKLQVELDVNDEYLKSILVHGLTKAVFWQDLKDHFMPCGEVRMTFVHGGLTARITYAKREEARFALQAANKAPVPGVRGLLTVQNVWNATRDSAVISVVRMGALVEHCRERGLDVREVLLDHFRGIGGEILDLTVAKEPLPPEFLL